MSDKTSGACLCGNVQYEITGSYEGFFLCHCSRCRKGSGSAHASNLFSTTAKVNWVSGQENVKTYNVPNTRHQRSFCATCGSAVPGIHSGGAFIVVPAGSVDTTITTQPTAHICYSSRAEWEDSLSTAPKMDGLPG